MLRGPHNKSNKFLPCADDCMGFSFIDIVLIGQKRKQNKDVSTEQLVESFIPLIRFCLLSCLKAVRAVLTYTR